MYFVCNVSPSPQLNLKTKPYIHNFILRLMYSLTHFVKPRIEMLPKMPFTSAKLSWYFY